MKYYDATCKIARHEDIAREMKYCNGWFIGGSVASVTTDSVVGPASIFCDVACSLLSRCCCICCCCCCCCSDCCCVLMLANGWWHPVYFLRCVIWSFFRGGGCLRLRLSGRGGADLGQHCNSGICNWGSKFSESAISISSSSIPDCVVIVVCSMSVTEDALLTGTYSWL